MSPDPTLPLEKQLFQWLCLIAGLITLLLVVPINHFQASLSPWVNRIASLFGLELLLLFWAARRGHYLRATTFFSILIGLDLVWFPNGGSQGSIGLYFFGAALFLVLQVEGTFRYAGFVLLVVNIIGLHVAELAWPHLLVPFEKTDRLVDLSTGYFISLLICTLMLGAVLAGFKREKGRLAESERLYRELLERQGEGFSMLDAQERFAWVNPVAEKIFGVAPGQLLGRSLMEFLPVDQQELVREESSLRAQGLHSTYEVQIRREDGALRTLQVTATPKPGLDGEATYFIGVFHDITERKHSEAVLQLSEERLRLAMLATQQGWFDLDLKTGKVITSQEFSRLIDDKTPEVPMTYQTWVESIHLDDRSAVLQRFSECVKSGEIMQMEYRMKARSGAWKWFRSSAKVVAFDATGLPARMTGTHTDITERKQAEEALKASEERYRAQFDRASEGIFTMSLDGELLEVNDALARMHGYTPEEMLKLKLEDLNTPEHSKSSQERMRRLLAGEALTFEVEHFHKDGHVFPLEISAGLVTASDRPFILSFQRDISERRKAEETRQLLEQEKQQAQKMDSLGSLAGGVAHDFNNMLGGIMGYADLLLAGETDPVRQNHLRAILAASSRSAELTQKLLAFGRRGKNRVESIDLGAVARECLDLLRPSMGPDLQLAVSLEDCPRVDGDPSQIHQVIVNLLINAIEAMPERGILTLAASRQDVSETTHPGLALPAGSYIEVSISDSGMGMTENVRERIFEPFFTTKNSSGMPGTGLGLSTAYGIVHAHGGTIAFDSIRGKGSTFRVILPIGNLPHLEPESPVGSSPGHGMVLLVEDEPLLRELGIAALESLGYAVVAAADGVEAVAAFEIEHARLGAVLLDLKMPRLAGRGAFVEMRKIDPGVPVIVCTGYGDNEEVQELLTLGAAGMLAKPYRIGDLAEKLHAVTRR